MAWAKKQPVQKVLAKGSAQQEAIWDAAVNSTDHLVVKALAGTGKTYSMVETLNRVSGGLSTGFVAFNKSIANELKTRVPEGVQACTMHSLGNSSLRQKWRGIRLDEHKVEAILREEIGGSASADLSKPEWDLKTVCLALVGLAKNTLAGGLQIEPTDTEYSHLMDHFSVDAPDGVEDKEVFEMTTKALVRSAEETETMDFDDMIWLPVVHELRMQKFDLLCVDEAQDLNRSQQELVLNAADRFGIVGDTHQAIYGFRGADVDSIPNMISRLQYRDHGRGCTVLPLTISRRCPKSHVRLAAEIVPGFEAMPDAIEGTIDTKDVAQALQEVKGGDLMICRTNAPVCELAYKLLSQKRPVKIQGRDIGQGIITVIRQYKGTAVTGLIEWMQKWRDREIAKLNKKKYVSKTRLQMVNDRYNCILAFTPNCRHVDEVIDTINFVFADTRGAKNDYVLLSSVHRAKGLEANHVHILCPELLPAPWAKKPWETVQEKNLEYVAKTRSKSALTFVPNWHDSGIDTNGVVV